MATQARIEHNVAIAWKACFRATQECELLAGAEGLYNDLWQILDELGRVQRDLLSGNPAKYRGVDFGVQRRLPTR